MPISLRVEKYCYDCPDFEPDVHKIAMNGLGDNIFHTSTTIKCKHRNKCDQLAKGIRAEIVKENKDAT